MITDYHLESRGRILKLNLLESMNDYDVESGGSTFQESRNDFHVRSGGCMFRLNILECRNVYHVDSRGRIFKLNLLDSRGY
jgi:hypothetical protein